MGGTVGSLWNDIKPLVFFGWVVAAIRFALEFVAPQQAWFFGVYWLMPIALIYFGVQHKLEHVAWPRLALSMVLLGVLVWFVPNAIAYTTAQFQGWSHGRFAPQTQSAPIAPTPGAKIGTGLTVAALTALGGSFWCIVWSTLVIWLPGYLRRRKQVAAA